MSFSTLKDGLINKGKKHEHQHSVLSLVLKNCIIIQSNQFINGIPLFVAKADENLNFETYHCAIEYKIPSLSSNRITTVYTRSVLNEIVTVFNYKFHDVIRNHDSYKSSYHHQKNC